MNQLLLKDRVDVRLLKRKAEWVLYSACTPEQTEAANTYFKLYEAMMERWHTKAFLKSFLLPLVGFGLLLTVILLCVSVRGLEELFRQFNF